MAIVDGLGAINANNNAQSDSALEELGESMEGLIDGIHDQVTQASKNEKLITEQQADMVKQLASLVDNTDPANQPTEEDPLTAVSSFLDGIAEEDDKKGMKQKGKIIDKPTDLLKLPECYSLPAILLWSKLDSIEKKMDGKDNEKKKGGIGDFFKGLLEGAAGIALLAIALIIFAGALVVFGIVDWGKALLGMISFTLFVLGSILLAKLVRRSVDDFAILALGAALLAVGLLVFAFALMVCGMLSIGDIIKSIFVIGLFLLFTLATVVLGNMVTASIGQFIALAVGSALLAVGLAIFALALMVCGLLSIEDIIKGIMVAAVMLVFMLAFGAIGVAILPVIPSLISLGIGSILLSVGLLVFSLALREAMKVGQLLSTPEGLESAMLIGIFFLGFMALASIISLVSPMLLLFSAASILLSVGLILFSLAVSFSIKMLTAEKLSAFIALIPNMLAIFGGMAAVGLICIVATVMMAFFVAASTLLMVGMLLFTGAVAMMFLTGKLLSSIDIGSTLGGIIQIMSSMVGIGIISIVATVMTVFFVAASVLLLVGMLAFAGATAALLLVHNILTKLGIKGLLVSLAGIAAIMTVMIGIGSVSILSMVMLAPFTAASILLLVSMLSFEKALESMISINDHLNTIGLVGLIKMLVGITGILAATVVLGAAALVAMIPIGIFTVAAGLLATGILSIANAIEAMDEIQKKVPSILPAGVSVPPVVTAIQNIFKAVSEISIGPIVMLKIAALAFNAGILASVFKDSLIIFRAITKTQDTIKDLEDKGIKFEQLMDPFKQIFQCVGDAAGSMQNVSKKAAEAMAIAIVPMTEAIDNVAHTIVYLADFAMDPQMQVKMDNAKIAFGRILTDFFGAGVSNPPPSTMLGMMYGLQPIGFGAASAVDALVPVAEAINVVTDTVIKASEMQDPGEAIRKLRQVVEFCSELNIFASTFTGEPQGGAKLGNWLIGKKTSVAQFKDAADSINSMNPMIDAIVGLTDKLNTLQDVALSLSTLEKVFALASPEDMVTRGQQLKKFATDVKDSNNILPSQNKLANFFDELSNTLTKGDFSKLNDVARGANDIAKSISNMNAELTKLRQENSQTMKDVSNMNKSNNSIGGVVNGAISTIGNIFGKDNSSSDMTEIIRTISDNVKKVAENTTPAGQTPFGIRRP